MGFGWYDAAARMDSPDQFQRRSLPDGLDSEVKRLLAKLRPLLQPALQQSLGIAMRLNGAASSVESIGRASRRHAAAASAAARQMTASLMTLAFDTGELGQAAANIADHVQLSCASVKVAAAKAREMSEPMERLSGAVSAMHETIALAEDMAGQINLLALNAAIEAARASEGAGDFSVVTAGVQALADEAASLIEALSGRAGDLQAEIEAAARITRSLNEVMQEAGAAAALASAAIGQQEAAARGLQQSLHKTATGMQDTSRQLEQILLAAAEMSAASQVLAEALGAVAGGVQEVCSEMRRWSIFQKSGPDFP